MHPLSSLCSDHPFCCSRELLWKGQFRNYLRGIIWTTLNASMWISNLQEKNHFMVGEVLIILLSNSAYGSDTYWLYHRSSAWCQGLSGYLCFFWSMLTLNVLRVIINIMQNNMDYRFVIFVPENSYSIYVCLDAKNLQND